MSEEVAIAQEFFGTLLRTERLKPAELMAYQAALLSRLVRHAAANVPYYRQRLNISGDVSPSSDAWRQLKFMSRRDLVESAVELRTLEFPTIHGQVTTAFTGGSTGPSARRDLSSLESLARFVVSYRMFDTWKLDQGLDLYWLRKTRGGAVADNQSWGFPWLPESHLGRRRVKDIASPAIEQLEFMRGDKPVYVNTLPSNILRLVEEARRTRFTIEIPCIISVAEYLGPEVRKAALETFGARTIDVFSSAEGGVIAIECPDSGLYHIQSELVLVEIIREDGQACKEGEIGEVVVTPLYNYATPLLRYRSGDFVEVGPQCRCGRCLPTISRVVGRREHMFLFPDGTRRLPQIDRIAFADIVSHDKWVLVQTGRDTAELRIAGDVTRAQRAEILHLAHAALEDQFQTQLQVVEDLPLTSGSKRHFTLNAFNPSAG